MLGITVLSDPPWLPAGSVLAFSWIWAGSSSLKLMSAAAAVQVSPFHQPSTSSSPTSVCISAANYTPANVTRYTGIRYTLLLR